MSRITQENLIEYQTVELKLKMNGFKRNTANGVIMLDGTEYILDSCHSFIVLQASSLTPLYHQGARHCQGPPVLLNGVDLSRNLTTVIDTPYREGRPFCPSVLSYDIVSLRRFHDFFIFHSLKRVIYNKTTYSNFAFNS